MLQLVEKSDAPNLGNSIRAFILAKRVEGHSKKTLEWYRFLLTDLEKRFGPEYPISSVTTQKIREHLAVLEDERRLSKSSLWNHLRLLRRFFRWCVSEEIASVEPTVPIPKIRLPKQFPKVMAEEDVEKLLKACDASRYEGKRNTAIILMFLDTGVRLSELTNLFPADLNLLNRSILIHQGKGGKSRIVFIAKRTTLALRRWLEIRHRHLEEPLFCTRHGEALKPRSIQELLDRLAEKANLNSKVSPHRLRHTAATMMAKAGMNAFELAQLLGHSDIKTTQIYCHLGGTALREAHAKASPVDKLFSGG